MQLILDAAPIWVPTLLAERSFKTRSELKISNMNILKIQKYEKLPDVTMPSQMNENSLAGLRSALLMVQN